MFDRDFLKTVMLIVFIASLFCTCNASHVAMRTPPLVVSMPVVEWHRQRQQDTPKIKQTITKLAEQSNDIDPHSRAVVLKMADLMFRLVDSTRARKAARDTAVKKQAIAEKQKDSVIIKLNQILAKQDRDSKQNADGFRKQEEYQLAKEQVDNQNSLYTKVGTACLVLILLPYLIDFIAWMISILYKKKPAL